MTTRPNAHAAPVMVVKARWVVKTPCTPSGLRECDTGQRMA